MDGQMDLEKKALKVKVAIANALKPRVNHT